MYRPDSDGSSGGSGGNDGQFERMGGTQEKQFPASSYNCFNPRGRWANTRRIGELKTRTSTSCIYMLDAGHKNRQHGCTVPFDIKIIRPARDSYSGYRIERFPIRRDNNRMTRQRRVWVINTVELTHTDTNGKEKRVAGHIVAARCRYFFII